MEGASHVIHLATLPGSPTRPNEDLALASPHALVLLDGAGGPAELASGCTHGTAWFVRHLGSHLHHLMATRPDHALAALLGEAITAVAALHPACDLDHPGTPSATVVALRPSARGWEWLVLGDSTLLLQSPEGEVLVVCDDRIDHVAPAEKTEMERHRIGTLDHQRARVAKVARERELRNTRGGFWAAAADPGATAQALTGMAPALARAALMSDGAARWLGFTGRTPTDLMAEVSVHGPAHLVDQVRRFEAADPGGAVLPRPKTCDDATLLLLETTPEVP